MVRPARKVFNSLADNAYMLLTLTTLFWAGNFVVGRGMHEQIPPLTLAWLRWMLGSFILLPFAWRQLARDWPVIRENFGVLSILGGIGIGGFNSFAYIGLNHTTALNGVIIQSAGPMLIMLMALALFGERFSLRQLTGVITSLFGVLIIIGKGQPGDLLGLRLNIGDLWMLGAMTIWALYTVILRKRPNMHPLSFLTLTILMAAAVNTPGFLYEFFFVRRMVVDGAGLLAVLYVAVFPSIIAYLFYNRGVALIGGNRAGAFLHLVPLFGSALAILLLGEQPQLYHLAGFALILTGIALAARNKR